MIDFISVENKHMATQFRNRQDADCVVRIVALYDERYLPFLESVGMNYRVLLHVMDHRGHIGHKTYIRFVPTNQKRQEEVII